MNYKENLEKTIDNEFERSKRDTYFSLLLLIVIVVAYTFWQSRNSKPLTLQWTENVLEITEPEGQIYRLDLQQVTDISLRDVWDYGTVVQGGENRSCRYGLWENPELGTYRLYMWKASPSVILLKIPDETVAISYESDDFTKDLYDMLAERLKEIK